MVALLRGPVPRLVAVGLVLLGVQNAVLANHPVFDVRLQILLALVAAAGAACGSGKGTLAGFVLGAMYDLSVGYPLGQTALAYGLAGFVAGYLPVLTEVPRWWMTAGFVAVGAVVGELAVPSVMVLTGQSSWIGVELFKVVPIVVIGCVPLGAALLPVARWATVFRKPQWKAMAE